MYRTLERRIVELELGPLVHILGDIVAIGLLHELAISCPHGATSNNDLKLDADLVVVDPMFGIGDDTLALNARHDLKPHAHPQ